MFFFNFIYLFIYFWLCWVFVSVRGLSLVAVSGGHSSSRCAGLSLSWPPFLRSTVSTRAGSVVVAHGPSCSAACGIFPDQGLNPCPLHWQADSQPLRHQGSPWFILDSHLSRDDPVSLHLLFLRRRRPSPNYFPTYYKHQLLHKQVVIFTWPVKWLYPSFYVLSYHIFCLQHTSHWILERNQCIWKNNKRKQYRRV